MTTTSKVRCPLSAYDAVSTALEEANIATENSEIAYIPTTLNPITDKDTVGKLLRLTEALDELDDVQGVFDNSDIAPELMDDE